VAASPLLALGLIDILERSLPIQAFACTAEDVAASRGPGEGVAAVVLAPGGTIGMLLHAQETPPSEETAMPSEVDLLCGILMQLRRRCPSLKIIVLVARPLGFQETQRVVRAGAKGYMSEDASEAEIKMAFEVVLDGSIWAPRKVLASIIEAGTALQAMTPDEPVEELSTREQEVMELLMSGRSNREIAAALGIEQATVKAHLGRMLRKTRSRNRLEMTLRQMELIEAKAQQQTDAKPATTKLVAAKPESSKPAASSSASPARPSAHAPHSLRMKQP
jgi:DNA-binding NarL/FixJ family response regulator